MEKITTYEDFFYYYHKKEFDIIFKEFDRKPTLINLYKRDFPYSNYHNVFSCMLKFPEHLSVFLRYRPLPYFIYNGNSLFVNLDNLARYYPDTFNIIKILYEAGYLKDLKGDLYRHNFVINTKKYEKLLNEDLSKIIRWKINNKRSFSIEWYLRDTNLSILRILKTTELKFKFKDPGYKFKLKKRLIKDVRKVVNVNDNLIKLICHYII